MAAAQAPIDEGGRGLDYEDILGRLSLLHAEVAAATRQPPRI